MEDIIKKYSNLNERVSKSNPEYVKVKKLISKLETNKSLSPEQIEELKTLKTKLIKIPTLGPTRPTLSPPPLPVSTKPKASDKKPKAGQRLGFRARAGGGGRVIRDDSTATRVYYNRYADN